MAPCAGRSRSVIAGHGRVAMPPSISSLTSRWGSDTGALRLLWRVGPVAILHLAALIILLRTEYYDVRAHRRVPAGLGLSEFRLARGVAPSGRVGGDVAGHDRDPDPGLGAQIQGRSGRR